MPYRNLTSEQMDAVRFDGHLLLTACPGSGKTKTLVSKLCYILEHKELLKVGKKKIIALTYTNIAADTILERIMSYGIDSDSLWIGTIHSFCLNWIIKPNVDRIPRLRKGFNVIDEHEKEFLINEIKGKYKLSIHDKVNTALNLNFKPLYISGQKEHSVVMEYHTYLNSNRLIDFDLILNLSCRLLEKYDLVCERISLFLKHILVDEYQDTSHVQYEILRLIVTKKNTIMSLIGDQEQAIYTGLGAIVKNRTELIDFFELNDLTEMRLTGCFRSSQSIIDFYSKYKDEPYKINSLSEYKEFKSVLVTENTIDFTQLSSYISSVINTHLGKGTPPNEIAVLCPGWFDVIKLSNEIIALNPHFEIDGVMVSPIPKSNENFWLNLIKLLLIKKIPNNFNLRQKLLRDFHKQLYSFEPWTESLSSKQMMKWVNKIAITVDYDCDISDWISKVINCFCDYVHIDCNSESYYFKEAESLINATQKRMNKYKMTYKANDLHSFFNSKSGIKITTCHSTKGDEFEVVICTSLLNGKIPNWNDIRGCSHEHQNYVARRLLYVISSRAKKHLYMISESGCKTKGGYPYKVTPQL
ncbi:TPA: ATP-dependent helicase [Escherichia coli Nissle 1917]|uniref:UvrD-helicase domain-containing protein n=1 Tax=Enterobacter hormaechei TaxID=158836 RepID=UPI00210A4E2F|nr:ATP-dependent helicase [Enterobacter hormaechei]